MIEKYKSSWEYDCSSTPEAWTHNCYMLVNFVEGLKLKINELVDAVNQLNLCEQARTCYELIHKNEEPVDTYAEQRQWIGKLCKFWDYDGEEKWFSILENIDKNSPYTYCASGDWWYKHCEPVKPDDDIIYKVE